MTAKYSRQWLIEQTEKDRCFHYLLYYGHKASTDGSVTARCLSQWFPAPFAIDDVTYPTAEHFMMAEKARLFDDGEMLQNILTCQTPKEAKASTDITDSRE